MFAAMASHAENTRPASHIAEVDAGMCQTMREMDVLHKSAPVSCTQLRVVHFSYLGFDGKVHDDGAVMVMAALADHVQAIFATLLQRKFALAGAQLMQHYRGDDLAAMRANNTSAFNDRAITNGGAHSLHAYGAAIDINPIQNPFVQFEDAGKASYLPAAGSTYANRLAVRPGKSTRKGMAEEVVDVFAEHGFLIWGGDWDAPIDYQHFQISRSLAKKLAALPVAQAQVVFNDYVKNYRNCTRTKKTAAGLADNNIAKANTVKARCVNAVDKP
ncbi:D-alanyl-D-alanine carboxypeptidase-like protein [Herminiimonas fonticola]|uniref:D-alanyl-D-alanine carboxypeptidase-like protein n=2 Tax=Herminiimonas fonticola TaxID=303380 RepID=A0A4V3BW97_9BURK|nr:D-alanyl-D-alanine carboxypeptidase [Herminiimonas fonticola]TDN93608.1 D-alanyl-D-alanine carboxypeptidase-like protein [Herminiimonas fonticola]